MPKKSHGLSNSREYLIYKAMKQRCYNQKNPSYKDYGGRGITICKRWLASFQNFLDDMGYPPTLKHSIERIDNNMGYSIENCKWATRTEQNSNTRRCVVIERDGNRLTVDQWATKLNMPRNTLYHRLYSGWSEEKTLSTPLMVNQHAFKK